MTDERAAFEAYFADSRRSRGANRRPNFATLEDGTYADDHTQRHWWTWQRAIIAASASAQPVTEFDAAREQIECFRVVCKAVNETPALQSMLYDLDLMPEQTMCDREQWNRTVRVTGVVMDHLLSLTPPQSTADTPDYSELSREQLERHVVRLVQASATALQFWDRYALPPKAAPSCLVCGKLPAEIAIRHGDIPSVVVCKSCRQSTADTVRVPREPTKEMILAALDSGATSAGKIYRAMIAAAPKDTA